MFINVRCHLVQNLVNTSMWHDSSATGNNDVQSVISWYAWPFTTHWQMLKRVRSLIITVLLLTFSPKLITRCIVLHLRLRIFKQAKSGRRRWPTWMRGKLWLLQFFRRQLRRRKGEAFAPVKGSVELQFETRVGGWKWRHLVWNQIVAFPRKRHIVLDRNGSRRARLLWPVMWQGWWWWWRL